MKAAIFKNPYNIEVAEVEMPEIGPEEVLIKVVACGICGSDMQMFRTNTHREVLCRKTEDNLEVPGHEFSGVIEQIGSSVHDFKVGDRVVGVGMGGFAEYVPVPVNPFQLAKIPDSVSFEEAATTEPLADGLQMVRKANPGTGENVVVYGVGIIGLGVVQALQTVGVELGNIVAIDVSETRLAKAAELGAKTVNALSGDVIELVREICGSAPLDWPNINPPAVDVVIDCAGFIKTMKGPPPLQNALDMLKGGGVGRIICFGAYEGAFPIGFMPVIQKELLILGSEGYASDELVRALELMQENSVDRASLVTHRFDLSDVAEAFETQGSQEAIKVMVTP